jgi:transposase
MKAASSIEVRAVEPEELARFETLLKEGHYLGQAKPVGDFLRQVALRDGQWVGLLVWGPSAYKLKDRERWIGWSVPQRLQRLKLVVQNRRFLLLSQKGAEPNLASQVLGAACKALVQSPRTYCEKARAVVSLAMEPPLFVRPLTAEERQQLRAGLQSRDAFTLRRCQILLASAQGQRPVQIAAALGCASQTVRNSLHAFEQHGPDCVTRGSSRPHSAHRLLDAPRAERLRDLLHQSPRAFGYAQSHWTLPLAAEVCHQQGLSERVLSPETVRQAIQRLGLGWKRAKQWLSSPDPAYGRKKKPGRGC